MTEIQESQKRLLISIQSMICDSIKNGKVFRSREMDEEVSQNESNLDSDSDCNSDSAPMNSSPTDSPTR